MSDIRKETATAYPSADTLTGSETVMVIQDGHTKKTTVGSFTDKILATNSSTVNLSGYTAQTLLQKYRNDGQGLFYLYGTGGAKVSDLPVTVAGLYIGFPIGYYPTLQFWGSNGSVYYYQQASPDVAGSWHQVV